MAQIAYVKVYTHRSLGVVRSVTITGKYTSKADAETSHERGTIMSAVNGYMAVKEFNSRKVGK